ncbi:hypothetical protein Hamer_G005079, partial [Homarus americanus]
EGSEESHTREDSEESHTKQEGSEESHKKEEDYSEGKEEEKYRERQKEEDGDDIHSEGYVTEDHRDVAVNHKQGGNMNLGEDEEVIKCTATSASTATKNGRLQATSTTIINDNLEMLNTFDSVKMVDHMEATKEGEENLVILEVEDNEDSLGAVNGEGTGEVDTSDDNGETDTSDGTGDSESEEIELELYDQQTGEGAGDLEGGGGGDIEVSFLDTLHPAERLEIVGVLEAEHTSQGDIYILEVKDEDTRLTNIREEEISDVLEAVDDSEEARENMTFTDTNCVDGALTTSEDDDEGVDVTTEGDGNDVLMEEEEGGEVADTVKANVVAAGKTVGQRLRSLVKLGSIYV